MSNFFKIGDQQFEIKGQEGVKWKCGDCGSTHIVCEIEQPINEDMCHHQHPMGPPGRIIFSHPLSEPCPLRGESGPT